MRSLLALCAAVFAASVPASGLAGDAPPADGRFTWRADFDDRALDRSEARVQAAALDDKDNLVIAGTAIGPLRIGRECALSDDHHERAFVAKINRRGRVVWLRGLGSETNHGKLSGFGITALLSSGRDFVAVGSFDPSGADVAALAEAPPQQIARLDQNGRIRNVARLELPPVRSVVTASDGDLYVGGCRRDWMPPAALGLPAVLRQSGGFIARISATGEVRWRKPIRDSGADLPRKGVPIGPPMDCVTELLPTADRGVAAGGMFSGPFTIDRAALLADSGTFLVRLSPRGDVEWARTVAVRLVTTSFDASPQFAVLSSGSFVGSGVVPIGSPSRDASGLTVIAADGRSEWSREIRSGPGCCNVDSPLATRSRNDVLVAGITEYGRSVEVGDRKLIENASANAFALWMERTGAPLRGRALHESATELSRLVVGRRGVWIVGTHRNGGGGTGLFADWIPN
jgi:hypothetical protein